MRYSIGMFLLRVSNTVGATLNEPRMMKISEFWRPLTPKLCADVQN